MSWLLVLAACTNWIDQEPACGLEPYGWSDDLLTHVLTGDGSGSFAYDPEDEPRTWIEGVYDPSAGTFSWHVDYADGYWLVSSDVAGYGTAYHNGDLDVEYIQTDVDVLGVTTQTGWRVERHGCDETAWTWDAAGDASEAFGMAGSYVDDTTYSWTASDMVWNYQGGRRQNLSHSRTATLPDGTWSQYDEYTPEGTGRGTFGGTSTSFCGNGLECDGAVDWRFDGGYHFAEAITKGGAPYYDVSGDFDYDGSGTERYIIHDDGGDVTCDLVIAADGACSYTCDDGDTGDCS